ncbi:hypothetical protein ACFWWC_37455 [Streptomyces sp. NPDC058642]
MHDDDRSPDEFIISCGKRLDDKPVTVDDFLITAMLLGGHHV